MELRDRFNRRIDYLRISVTDRCNLRCIYCMPPQGITVRPPQESLSFEEIARVVRTCSCLGIDKVRITGGEPLVRRGIAELVKILSQIKGLNDISMTTNGILLKDCARELKDAGLDRVNISLDTLQEDRYRFITRGGDLRDVKESIKAALRVGLSPLKINVLLFGGKYEDEVIDFLRLTVENPVHVRFLEFMPVRGNSFWKEESFVSSRDVIKICRRLASFSPVNIPGSGPSRNFQLKDALGTFGFISPMSEKFCSGCNRLRLTSDGFLKGCLHSDYKVNLRDPLREGIGEKVLSHLIELAVTQKPMEHSLDKDTIDASEYLMCQIGG